MTSFSQLSFLQAKNTEFKKPVTMNALAFVVCVLLFLISTIAHADHLTTQVNNTEQQECFICHQGVNTPPELSNVHTVFVASYTSNTYLTIPAQFNTNSFIQPQLRAPPAFL